MDEYERCAPNCRLYSINMSLPASTFLSQCLPLIYIPFESIRMFISVVVNVFAHCLLHRGIVRLFEWNEQ